MDCEREGAGQVFAAQTEPQAVGGSVFDIERAGLPAADRAAVAADGALVGEVGWAVVRQAPGGGAPSIPARPAPACRLIPSPGWVGDGRTPSGRRFP